MPLLGFNDFDIKLNIDSKYKAHLSKDKQSKESLEKHIDLVFDYFFKLIEQNGLEVHLNSLFEKSANLFEEIEAKEEFMTFVKYLFAKAIYWHDMGKINPNFQKEKMLNDIDEKTLVSDSHHSHLGAYLFINHSLDELYDKNLSDEEETMECIIYLFGFLISKHHGKVYKYEDLDFQMEFVEFLGKFDIETEHTKILKDKNRLFSSIFDYIENNQDVLFLLAKSLFSLLIISDYYATAQFMNYGNCQELKYNDFGLINKTFVDKIYKEFYTDKFDKNKKQITFNQLLGNKSNEDFKNFTELQEKSNENLNHLRNKLFVEVRTNLRENLEKNLFYIEAPTGAGKTNLSLMSVVEILKKDTSITKVFYVFPFTTLITQTYISIKKTLELNNAQIVQLHSKAKYNQKKEEKEDGVYGNEKDNFLDNQFMNYPITLLSHVKFFDILTGISKDDNYIFHRLANSIVIIDEIQTYSPDFWAKIVHLLDIYAKNFNIKFIVMSATLPKIGKITDSKFTFLVFNKQDYFQNPNFGKRVEIDTNVISINKPEEIYQKLEEESLAYQNLETTKSKKVKTIIEFITKKGADEFYKYAQDVNTIFDDIFILSGTILEPRRKEIIDFIKNVHDKNILLVTTQVVEAGVDIDMDIGFKEKSLLDSDEQLAGRINRNSSKEGNKLFLFIIGKGNDKFVYKTDKRKGMDGKYQEDGNEQNVLITKDFDKFYDQILDVIIENNYKTYMENLNTYKTHIQNLRFNDSHIKLIDMQSVSVFVPISNEAIQVWSEYEQAITNQEKDLIGKKIDIKKLSAKISKYTFSLADYPKSGIEYLETYGEKKYGYLYLKEWYTICDGKKLYSYKDGLDTSVLKGDFVSMII
ncbi:CRISPR-associated Cas3 family helicase [Malaciobacter marinus]|uniref:CRISPR-associated Cas3 family helicase n=1 Tax=Malaciobacter marinus TaxID=505249 RepID=A0AB36ZZK7_9BACT|nr:CRISPR-associated helicase/endonuclease Cas3 [Malaciobacter marinus]PPK62448.1 CRISPR-associated Cas3 family helicase [Malaciobacter marinus]